MSRNSTGALMLKACSGAGHSSASISRLRVFPEPFSGEITASRGVLSKQSTAWLWKTHSATASRAVGDG